MVVSLPWLRYSTSNESNYPFGPAIDIVEVMKDGTPEDRTFYWTN